MSWVLQIEGDVQVLVVGGDLSGGWQSFEMKDAVTELVRRGERKFVIDLAAANFVNSTGIGVLLAMLATVRGSEGRIHFCSVGNRVRRSLVTTGGGIWESLEVYATREEALRAFHSSPA